MLFNSEMGIIDSVEQDFITILFTKDASCEDCGLQLVCRPGNNQRQILRLKNPGGLSLGQEIKVFETRSLELHLAIIQFGIPLTAFIGGLILGYFISPQEFPKELSAFLVSLIGLAASFFTARKLVRRLVVQIPDKFLEVRAVSAYPRTPSPGG